MAVIQDPDNVERTWLHDTVNLVDAHVLEIGCGEGRLTALYHQAVQKLVGIDVEIGALQIAKDKLPDKTGFALANALALPFYSSSFDVVIYAWSL